MQKLLQHLSDQVGLSVCLDAPASKGGSSCAEEHIRRRLVLVEEGGGKGAELKFCPL